MNSYTVGALVSFLLFGMGLAGLLASLFNVTESKGSKSSIQMAWVCVCVFFWDFGYAWMGLCYDSDFAYIARAIALLAVSLYMFFILLYVTTVTDYPKKKLNIFLVLFMVASLVAWTQIIQKNAVSFSATMWGYWYTSKMSWARVVQFASILAALIQYYVIMAYGLKNAVYERERYVLRRFCLFGPILFSGYILDTLAPSFLNIPAIPGSAISAFFSSVVLYMTSQKNKVFGLTISNVAEYVFADVVVPVIATDRDGSILLFNQFTTKYLGCQDEDIEGQNIEKFFRMNDGDEVAVIGSDRVCQLNKTEVKDQFDALLYYIYFMRDITEERKALRLAEESRELAQEANRAKTNFLANMSHEIRTPMNAIIGMSEIVLQDKSISEDTLSKVTDINIAGQNLLGIINDILDITKIEAGKYELVIDKYEMPSLIHDVSNIIAARLQETGIEFKVEVDETLPKYLIGDEGRVRQILLNILGNAVKFIKQGYVSFAVTWNHDEEWPIIEFEVEDTGIGIKTEDIGKIFGKFNQVDTRRNRNVQGTGLGLAISKHLASLMGGDIIVDSVYGSGSTFRIVIKQDLKEYKPIGAELASALEKKQYRSVLKQVQTSVVSRPDAKILIVDDTMINLKVASGLLKKYDIQADTAGSGPEAIEMVQKKDYDIVFMDHMMPGMDGIEATKQIRALGEPYESLVIIALTANAINDAKDMFLREGMQDFIAKPIEMKELDNIMNKWLPVEA